MNANLVWQLIIMFIIVASAHSDWVISYQYRNRRVLVQVFIDVVHMLIVCFGIVGLAIIPGEIE